MKNFSIKNKRWRPQFLLLAALLISPKTWAAPPNWTVDPSNFQFNMSLLARLKTNGLFENSGQNMVGVFVGNELRGVAAPILLGGSAYFFTTIYSNSYAGEALNFRVFVQSDDKIYQSTDAVVFRHNDFSGNFGAPFLVKVCRDYPLASSIIEPTCNGSSNGTIFTNFTGIAPPFTYLWSNGKTTKNINLLPAGTFTVTVTDAGGCTSTKSTTLAQPPAISFSVNFAANPPGYDANFTTGGGTGAFVFNRTGMVSTDFRAATDPIFDHLAVNTTFVFKARDANGCLKSVIKKTPTTMPSASAAVERKDIFNKNVLSENQFAIFPNPVDEVLNVEFLFDESQNRAVRGTVSVLDLLGRAVFFEKLELENGQVLLLPVQHLPTGGYALFFRDEFGKTIGARFVVARN